MLVFDIRAAPWVMDRSELLSIRSRLMFIMSGASRLLDWHMNEIVVNHRPVLLSSRYAGPMTNA